MDLLAEERVLLVLILAVFFGTKGCADPVYAEGVYGLSRVDFFLMRADRLEPEEVSGRDLWIEPRMNASGEVVYYRPPEVVEDLLTSPNRETALRYISWNQRRLERINDARRMLEMIEQEELRKEPHS